MNLVADRFVETEAGRVVDLATGESVALTISSAGGPTDEVRWAARCAWFQRLQHPVLAQLVDYGALGETRRFEAWRHACRHDVLLEDARAMAHAASAFLRACGLTASDELRPDRRAVSSLGLIPREDEGYPCEEQAPADGRFALDNCGIVLVERSAVTAIAELFGPGRLQGGPQVVCVWGASGTGKTSVVRELARAARLDGMVPMDVRLLASSFASVLEGRTAFLIDEKGSAWRRGLLDAVVRSARAHVVVCTALEDPRDIAGIGLSALPASALVGSIRPSCVATSPRLRRIAERANGNPRQFIRQLQGARYHPGRTRIRVARVAERAPAYGAADENGWPAVPQESTRWPDRDEVFSLRQRMKSGMSLLAAGRHAPGDRLLRQAIGGLARREEWMGAAEGSLALAGSLLRRGRPREARSVLDAARPYSGRTSQGDMPVKFATLAGVAWTDSGRLEEAENVLAAVVTSGVARVASAGVAAALALGRCRFWRGRFDDADDALPAEVAFDQPSAVRLHALRARIAVGRLDFTAAMASASEAIRLVEGREDAALVAEATCAAAFVHLSVGDLTSLERDVAACLTASRTARDPLRSLRARLMLAEQLRRAGRQTEAVAVMSSLERLALTKLPPILRWRYDLMHDLLTTSDAAADLAARHATSSGLPALVLFGPPGGAAAVLPAAVDDALAVLHLCQAADEEGATLAAVCRHVQRRLEAAAVAFFAPDGGGYPTIACAGSRIEPEIARRAAAAGVPIGPHRIEDRVESAVPVRYGGAIVGALAARWTVNRSTDASRVVSVLTMAATAAAPLVQFVLAGRARTHGRPTDGLLGVSAAMAEVRRAAERAALAPFAVLVEGESGSGKELVARAVHRGSQRRERPFRTLNCAALPDDLVESELFGHARGAFTGAVAERVGVFEEAHSGTLLLDEVGELSLRAQAKLLRVIQEGELRRIGENTLRRIDVRIVAATNRDLRQEAAAGRFRLDLLYRLDVVRIAVPSLRDRREDIPLLVEHFWHEAAERVGSRATLGPSTVAALARYDWPGNVRELQNVLAALAVRTGRRGVVGPAALPPQFCAVPGEAACRLDAARRAFDERFVRAALVRTGGSRTQTASELGISRQGLTKLMTRLGIAAEP
jgi:DNA-binding NtrC family response regulator